MGFTQILRRAASRAIPLATRSTVGQTYPHHHPSTLFRALSQNSLSQNLFRSSFSSAVQRNSTSSNSDDTLLKIIDSEIHCAQESDQNLDKAEDVPERFPFKIEDQPGLRTLTLTRDFQGERITVVVHMPDLITGEEDENDDDDDSESGTQSQLPMVVRVSKNDGPCLEFGVSAYPDEVAIETLSIKDPKAGEDEIAYEGPDFAELDENLQKAFHKYLDIRGINPRSTNFLHEYMINKDTKEYVKWLQRAKNFLEA